MPRRLGIGTPRDAPRAAGGGSPQSPSKVHHAPCNAEAFDFILLQIRQANLRQLKNITNKTFKNSGRLF